MFARSVTISGIVPSTIDRGIDQGIDRGIDRGVDRAIAFVRDDAMPELTRLGCVGMSLVVDRTSQRLITTSAWETREALDATRAAMAPYRAEAAALMGGEVSIEDWEVAMMHRDHDAFALAACRITWARTSDVEALLHWYRTMTLPSISEATGFCSVSMFVDRERGTVCGTTTFDSLATMVASRARAEANRLRMAEFVDVDYTAVGEFELVVARLHLPELV